MLRLRLVVYSNSGLRAMSPGTAPETDERSATSMRIHFISRLALLLVGAFLVVASQEAIWVGDTLKWMFIGGGAVAIAFALADSIDDNLAQRGLDALTVLIGAWMVVEALILNRPDIKWWSFGAAAALAGISAIGLAVHE